MKKKNFYYSFIFIFMMVSILTCVTFSYYEDDVESNTEIEVDYTIDNRISSDYIRDGYVELDGHESIDITLYLISNSSIETNYKIYYVGDEYIDVTSNDILEGTIKENAIISYNITVSNYADYTNKIYIDVLSGTTSDELVLESDYKLITSE